MDEKQKKNIHGFAKKKLNLFFDLGVTLIIWTKQEKSMQNSKDNQHP